MHIQIEKTIYMEKCRTGSSFFLFVCFLLNNYAVTVSVSLLDGSE